MTTENKQAPEVDETAQEQQEDSVANTADEAESTPSKTYTQEDVDNLIAVQKAKLPNKEEWDAFQAWKNEAKDLDPEEPTKPEVTTDQRLSELEAKLAKAEEEATQLRNLNAVRSSGVSEDFAEYAAFEVNKLVDKDKDFETALKEWIEANQP